MFPDYLDGAKVLEYTDMGHYGFVTDFDEDDHPIEKEIRYYAIAQYEKDTGSFYIFSCDESFEVFGDGCLWTLEMCKNCANLPENIVWHKK
ncbi:MAG: hypothetical protein IJO05_06565 [Oscillospiraceae bacterium]|nr:hypothetical protein [Oscillospiraceae bacterium]